MAPNDDIQSGLRTVIYDYDRPLLIRAQILVTDKASRYMIAWIAVLLSLFFPFLFVWLRRILLAILPNPSTDVATVTEPGFRATVMNYISIPGDQDSPIKSIKLIGEQAGSRIVLVEDDEQTLESDVNFWPATLESLKTTCRAINPVHRGFRQYLAFWTCVAYFALLFLGGIAASVVWADMANRSVISTVSPLAGAWKSNPDSPDYLLGDDSIIKEDRQMRIWAYKDACYGDQFDPGCEKFYTRKIPAISEASVSCPFDGEVCIAAKRFHFRKTMDCSPLRVDSPYVAPQGDAKYPNRYLYDYGSLKIGDYYEYYTYTNPMEWELELEDNTPYTLSPYVYVPGMPKKSNFQPLPEVSGGDKTVSLFFISTGGEHYHVLESNDPIFPAHERVTFQVKPGKFATFWMNNSTRAGVLGCVESYEICPNSTGSDCWSGPFDIPEILDTLEDDLERRRGFYLLAMALEDAYAWKMMEYSQASVLDATRKSQRIVGIKLDPEQWKLEVNGIFDATLAAVQIHIYDYARGTYRKHQNVIDTTPISLQSGNKGLRAAIEISQMVKFRDKGYRNVSALAFWATIGGCIFVFLGSQRFSTPEKRAEVIERTGRGAYHDYLLATIFWEGCIVVCVQKVGIWLYNGVVWTAAWTNMLYEWARRRGKNNGNQTQRPISEAESP